MPQIPGFELLRHSATGVLRDLHAQKWRKNLGRKIGTRTCVPQRLDVECSTL